MLIHFIFFVYSGLLKWIPYWPADPTLLFGAGLSISSIFIILNNGIPRISDDSIKIIIVFLSLFFIWYFFSILYTKSNYFWQQKSLGLITCIISLISPLICLRNTYHFNIFNQMIIMIGLTISSTIIFLYSQGTLDLIIGSRVSIVNNIPDYLALGAISGMVVIIGISKKGIWYKFNALIGFIALALLAGRGPILFSILSIILGLFIYRSKNFENQTNVKYILLGLSIFSIILFSWSGSELILKRFSFSLSSFERTFEDIGRLESFTKAFAIIENSPIIGIGLGGYGVAAYGSDYNTYPHNLLLEAFAETGAIRIFILFYINYFINIFRSFLQVIQSNFCLLLILIFTFMNYSKSGGFIGARDLFMVLGLFLAYTNFFMKNKRVKILKS